MANMWDWVKDNAEGLASGIGKAAIFVGGVAVGVGICTKEIAGELATKAQDKLTGS
jgi:hypothetical protein